MRTLYYREKQHFANVPFFGVPCRAASCVIQVHFNLRVSQHHTAHYHNYAASLVHIQVTTRAASLHDADLILWYICMYPWQAAGSTYIQPSFTRTFYSCLYIVLFFRINIQYCCIFSVYLCSFRAILVCLCSNYTVLCSFVWKNRIAQ